MKNINKTISIGLVTVMLANVTVPVSVSALSSNGAKEEVIYIMTDASGSVDGVYSVSTFDKGSATDYGTYENVKMLNTNDNITTDGDKITFNTDSDKAYLQGTLINKEIPWNISIQYILDGKELTPDELAGKSGNLEIKFKVEENKKCNSNFYDNYALQAAFTLDTEKCSNIVADDATLANVGSKKQLSYTILPGKGIDTSITTDVKDFEMDAVAINGVKMNLDIQVDDSEITDKTTELTDGVSKLDDGAKELSDGAATLSDGAGILKSGAASVNTGADALKSGVDELADGAGTLTNGADEVNSAADSLKDGTEQISDGSVSLQNGVLALKNGGESLKNGSSQLSDGASALDTGIKNMASGSDALQSGLDQLISQSKSLTSGSSEILAALNQIQSSLDAVSADTQSLQKPIESSGEIKSAIIELRKGAEQLQNNLGFSQYKSAMLENGLDIDALTAGNAAAIQNISAEIEVLQYHLAQIDGVEGYEDQAQQLQQEIYLLSETVDLLSANNGAIAVTEQYMNSVSQGASQLYTGLDELESNYTEFDHAINTLVAQLTATLADMQNLSDAINTLTSKYTELDTGINDYTVGVAGIADGYAQLAGGFSKLAEGSKSLASGSQSLDDGSAELYNGISALYGETGKFVDGTQTLANGMQMLSSGTSELSDGTANLYSGVNTLVNGAKTLSDGTETLSEGADSLYGGTVDLKNGAMKLADGTTELRDKTSGIDKQIEEKIDDMISSIQGSDSETVSFVSEKNTSVESVQFIIKTQAIEMPEELEAEKPAEEKLTFWQKFLKLFDLKK